MNTPSNQIMLKIKGDNLPFTLFPVSYKTALERKKSMNDLRKSKSVLFNKIILKRHFENECYWFYYHLSESK